MMGHILGVFFDTPLSSPGTNPQPRGAHILFGTFSQLVSGLTFLTSSDLRLHFCTGQSLQSWVQ
jgi:hypothetical protein